MPKWSAEQYLRFESERTRPCRDLVAAIALSSAHRIIDLGCGPGNSTAVLATRWPEADLTGLDSSEEMIAAARRDAPGRRFITADIAAWKGETPFDLIFSNAAFQWVPGHAELYRKLFVQVASGGAMATQVPSNFEAPVHTALLALAALPTWQRYFPSIPKWYVHPPAFYFDVLAPVATRLDIWETTYIHVLANADAIVEWYKGTGLRPFLDALPDAERKGFLEEYRRAIVSAYPAQSEGRVLFPFRRLFVIAYKSLSR
jgi:trans-aconitate 2-methyltransferase